MAELESDFIEREIGGKPIKFAKLTVRNRLEMLKRLKAVRRQQLIDNLKAVSADKEQTYGELNRFDETPMQDWDFITHANTPEGQMDALEMSLKKYHADDAAGIIDQMTLSIDDTLPLIAQLCGLKMKKELKDEANPTKPGEEAPATTMTTPAIGSTSVAA